MILDILLVDMCLDAVLLVTYETDTFYISASPPKWTGKWDKDGSVL